jgi:hypothetical protein
MIASMSDIVIVRSLAAVETTMKQREMLQRFPGLGR